MTFGRLACDVPVLKHAGDGRVDVAVLVMVFLNQHEHSHRSLPERGGRGLLVPQPLQKRVADFCLPCEPLVLRHDMQGALDKTTQVVGNRDVRVSRCLRADVGSTGLKRRNEPLKLDCEKLLVQPGNQFGHRDHRPRFGDC